MGRLQIWSWLLNPVSVKTRNWRYKQERKLGPKTPKPLFRLQNIQKEQRYVVVFLIWVEMSKLRGEVSVLDFEGSETFDWILGCNTLDRIAVQTVSYLLSLSRLDQAKTVPPVPLLRRGLLLYWRESNVTRSSRSSRHKILRERGFGNYAVNWQLRGTLRDFARVERQVCSHFQDCA